MFSAITVLAATKDADIVRCLRSMSFKVYQCDRIEDVLDRMETGHILFLDAVEHGNTDLNLALLGQWTRSTKRPVCLSRSSFTKEEIRNYRVQGVWDTHERWDDSVAEIQAIFRRYGSIMLDVQKLDQLETAQQDSSKKIKVLQRATIGLALLVVGLGGVEFIPKIVSMLPW